MLGLEDLYLLLLGGIQFSQSFVGATTSTVNKGYRLQAKEVNKGTNINPLHVDSSFSCDDSQRLNDKSLTSFSAMIVIFQKCQIKF